MGDTDAEQANRSIEFFSAQFDRQIAAAEYRLNVFEERALPWLNGDVLELGCGLGNLAIAAAERGCRVHAFDACNHALDDIQRRAAARGLALQLGWADVSVWRATRRYDAVVSIGLLMFLDRANAWRVFDEIERAVVPGGVCVLNVLVEGTTYMRMFDARAYCLFAPDALLDRFSRWDIIEHRIEDFDAPEPGTVKRFATLIACRPATRN